MVAANEYLLRVRKVAEPVQEVQCFLLTAVHGKIAGMDNNVSRRQIMHPPVAAMRVGNMQYSHVNHFYPTKILLF